MSISVVKLLSKKSVAYETMAFEFEKPADFNFLAGQYLDLKTINPDFTDPAGIGRDFSIASSPNEKNLLIATRLRNTPFKNFLKNAPLGTKFQIKGPAGSFVLPEIVSKPVVLIAGGIGIAPFRSMAKFAADRKLAHKIFLFYSNRRPEDAAFVDELNNLKLETQNFKLVATMTKPETSQSKWSGETGYVNAAMIKKYVDNFHGANYYIAGPPAIVQAMWQMLALSGVDRDNVKTEEFAGY